MVMEKSCTLDIVGCQKKINRLINEKNFLDENSEYDLVIDGDGIKMPCKSEKKKKLES